MKANRSTMQCRHMLKTVNTRKEMVNVIALTNQICTMKINIFPSLIIGPNSVFKEVPRNGGCSNKIKVLKHPTPIKFWESPNIFVIFKRKAQVARRGAGGSEKYESNQFVLFSNF